MTNQREAFEKWHKTKYRGLKYNSDSNGGFLNPRTDLDFDIWQAAQADQVKRVKELEAIIAMYKGIKKCTDCNIEWSDSNLDCPKCGKEVSL